MFALSNKKHAMEYSQSVRSSFCAALNSRNTKWTGQDNLTTGRIADYMNGSVVFVRLCHCASQPIHASLGSSEFKSKTASRSVQPFFSGITTMTDRQTTL